MAISEKACIEIQYVLERLEEYLDDRADADHNGWSYVGNSEMNLLRDLRDIREDIDQLIRNNTYASQVKS